MPVLIRAIDGEVAERQFACTYRAELADILLFDEFETAADRDDWIEKRLSFHRECYEMARVSDVASRVLDERHAFQGASTFYAITGLKEVKPSFPLTRLIKDSDGSPVSSDYSYGYAVCKYP